jgi:hypothetical protein
MSLWSNSDSANAAPKFTGASTGTTESANGSQMFGNTQIAAFQTNKHAFQSEGIFGVDVTEQGVSATSNTHPQHAGWVLVTRGTGPIISITANTGAANNLGSGYITLTGGGTGAVQANVFVTVDANNRIQNTAFTINEANGFRGGNYLISPTLSGSFGNAAFTFTLGGRAGRSKTETLVAMSSIGVGAVVADAADDAIFPDS